MVHGPSVKPFISDGSFINSLFFPEVDWIAKNGEEKKLPDLDFSPRQLFWIHLARTDCAVFTDEFLRWILRGDTHAPSRFRAIGVVQNSYEFSKDFNCGVNSAMNSRTKCNIW